MHMVKKNRKRKEIAENELEKQKEEITESNVEKEPNKEDDNSSIYDSQVRAIWYFYVSIII